MNNFRGVFINSYKDIYQFVMTKIYDAELQTGVSVLALPAWKLYVLSLFANRKILAVVSV